MGGGSKQSSESASFPGTLSPITASIISLFGGNPTVSGGQFVPTTFGQGGGFSPQSFGALPGLLQNLPLTGAEQTITSPQFQQLGLQNALQAQGLLQQGAAAIPDLLNADPTAAIAKARQQFSQETLPSILERAPGFSSSDLQRELGRAGTDLETNIAALREAGLGQRLQTAATAIPQFAQSLGTSLLDNASQVLGFGTLGRDLIRETSPAGDAFRVLTALQSLTTPAITSQGFGTSKGKSTQVL